MDQIKNLVFEGGGVKGIAYAGAIKALEEQGILQNISGVAGTSAGAITSCLVALKYSAVEVKDLVDSTNFKSFEDGWDPLEIPLKYGLYKGDAFLSWIKKAISKKTGSEDTTFQELKNAGYLCLKVFATDLNEKAVKEFSDEKTPTVKVAEAVRSSMSIPLFFRAWKFSNNIPDDHIYVDGGTIYNYPIDAFDKGGLNPDTLGFFLENTTMKPIPNNLKYDEILTYIKVLFDTVLLAQKIDFNQNASDKKQTIIIDDFGISATDFGLTNQQKTELFNSGYTATINFLRNYDQKVVA